MRDREQRQQETTGIVGRAREAAALEGPGLLAAVVEQTADAVFVKDLEGRYLLVNSACARILGRPKEEVVGRDDAQLLPPEAAERLARVDRLVMGTGEASSYEEVLPVDGRSRTFLSTKSVHRDAAGNALGIIGISVDISERKRAEEAAFEVREAERSRLARDLHDGPLQDLSVVVQELEVRRVASETEGPDAGLGREIDALRRAVRGLREAIYDLRPGEQASFLERLEEMVGHYRDLTPEREIDLVVEDGFPSELPEGAATQLLRLVREALTNARQHSAARRVRVGLGADGEELSVEVADDGRGFAAGSTGGGMGLSTMGERAALLGGDLEVSSEPGGGTRVRLRLARPDDAP